MQFNNLDLRQYMDYRKYLRDWLDGHRNRSYQSLGTRVGYSKSMIHQIIKGNRSLPPNRVRSFFEVLGLTEDRDQSYFSALVDLDSEELSRRRAALGQILSARHFAGIDRVGQDTYRFYSRWYYLALFELVDCQGFQEDPAWIAATLRPPITTEQAAEALETLESLGVLQRDDDGALIGGAFSSGHEVHDQVIATAITELHPSLLSLASEAVSTVPAEERQFEFVTFAMPQQQLGEYRELIRQFQDKVIELATGTKTPGDRVYQLCVQLFPISAPITPDEPDTSG